MILKPIFFFFFFRQYRQIRCIYESFKMPICPDLAIFMQTTDMQTDPCAWAPGNKSTNHLLSRAHAQGVNWSVCRCPQKIVIFRDIKSRRVVNDIKLEKSAKSWRLCARTCFSPSTSVTNHDFYTPRLFGTPTKATRYALCIMTAHAQSLYR